MELTLEEKQALAAARARARKRAAEAQAEGRPWEKFKSQDEDLKPWERATRQQDEAQQKPSESDIDEEFLWARARKRRAKSGKPQPVPDGLEIDVARARARAAMEQASAASAGKPWERFRDQSTAEARQAATLAEFEALPWYGKAGQAVMDVARLGADGATFGFADKLVAGLDAEAETLTSGLDTVRAVQSALEAAGVEFLNHGRPGVRLRDRSKE